MPECYDTHESTDTSGDTTLDKVVRRSTQLGQEAASNLLLGRVLDRRLPLFSSALTPRPTNESADLCIQQSLEVSQSETLAGPDSPATCKVPDDIGLHVSRR